MIRKFSENNMLVFVKYEQSFCLAHMKSFNNKYPHTCIIMFFIVFNHKMLTFIQ